MVDEFAYATLLLNATQQPITEENLIKVVSAAGASVDQTKAKAFVASLEGVNIEEAISKAAMPVASAPAQGEKKEELKEEDTAKKSEEAAGGLASLFG